MTFKVLKEKKNVNQELYLAKLPFKNEDKITTFLNYKSGGNPLPLDLPYEKVKGVFQIEMKGLPTVPQSHMKK